MTPATERKKLFFITGVSGAGKSQALKVFEDFGWFCVDNLPIALLDQFAQLGHGFASSAILNPPITF